MKIFKKILFYYCFFLIISLFSYGLRQVKSPSDLILVLILSLPTIFFLFKILEAIYPPIINEKKIILLTKNLKIISFFNCSILFLISLLGLLTHYNFILFFVFLPLPIYFLFKDEVKGKEKQPTKLFFEEKKLKTKKIEEDNLNTTASLTVDKKNKPIKDPSRREFIKIMGAGGVGLLIMTLLNPKKAEAAFFGSVPGPGTVAIKDSEGRKIDPAIKKPTDGYSIAQIDSSIPSYYGYMDKDGNWYIIKENNDGSFRYARGLGSFSTYWSMRSTLSYDYFDNVF